MLIKKSSGILNLCTQKEDSEEPGAGPLTARGKAPGYQCERRVSGTEDRSGKGGEGKILCS